MPPLLIVLSLLTVAMIVVALGVMFDALPAWSTRVESPAHRLVVMPNRILPILSSIVGIVFVTTIFRRYAQRGGTHLFVWGIGLAFFATGSMTESLHGLLGWNGWVFRFWYLFGAVLIAAWMGQGTMHLLAPKRVARVTAALLIVASVYATYKVFSAELDPTLIASQVTRVEPGPSYSEADVVAYAATHLMAEATDDEGRIRRRKVTPLARALSSAAVARGASIPAELDADRDIAVTRDPDGDLSVSITIDGQPVGRIELREAIVFSGHVITTPGVRTLTPFFNTFGIITLIGGAIYSAWVFWRKRIMPHRAVGNVVIAAGAILGGGASAFARFGMLSYLYLAELSSLILVFVGFLIATRRPRAESP